MPHIHIIVSGYISVDVTDEDAANVMGSDSDLDEGNAASIFARESAHALLDGIRSRDVDFSTIEFEYTEVH